jgi:hypothetical protein
MAVMLLSVARSSALGRLVILCGGRADTFLIVITSNLLAGGETPRYPCPNWIRVVPVADLIAGGASDILSCAKMRRMGKVIRNLRLTFFGLRFLLRHPVLLRRRSFGFYIPQGSHSVPPTEIPTRLEFIKSVFTGLFRE